jgi:hypothetical protein
LERLCAHIGPACFGVPLGPSGPKRSRIRSDETSAAHLLGLAAN